MTARGQGLRVGVVCAGTTLPAWEGRCIEALLRVPPVEVVLLVAGDEPGGRDPEAGGAIWRLYARHVVATRSRVMRPADVLRRLGPIAVVQGDDEAAVRAAGVDVVLRLAGGAGPVGALDVPRHGVWTFYYGDAGRYRAGPPGFWEIHDAEPVTGAVLVRLRAGGERGVVLYRGTVKTADYSYVRNLDRVCRMIAEWPARVCRDLLKGRRPARETAVPLAAPVASAQPTSGETVRVLLGSARRLLTKGVARLFLRDQWNVGIVEAPIHAFLSPRFRPAIRWLPDPAPHRFLADPFGVPASEGKCVLAEQYDYRARLGRIVVLESRVGLAFEAPRPAIELPGHASYPCTVVHQGDVYCIPETCQAREASLFRSEANLTRWVKVRTLVENFAALDPTVFRHDGLWWLFCGDGDTWPEATLYAWYAPDLLGPWHPHLANPLKTDIRGSRPAGTPFVHEGHLYRPAQDLSTTYGGAVTVNRVLALTPDEFEEEPVAVVRPDPAGPYPGGLHTLCAFGDRTLVDGKRRVLVRPHWRVSARGPRRMGSGLNPWGQVFTFSRRPGSGAEKLKT